MKDHPDRVRLFLCALLTVPLAGCAAPWHPPQDWTVHTRTERELRASSGDGARLLVRWHERPTGHGADEALRAILGERPEEGWLILERRPVTGAAGSVGLEVLLEKKERIARGQEMLWLVRALTRPTGTGTRVVTAEVLARAPVLRHYRQVLEERFAELGR